MTSGTQKLGGDLYQLKERLKVVKTNTDAGYRGLAHNKTINF